MESRSALKKGAAILALIVSGCGGDDANLAVTSNADNGANGATKLLPTYITVDGRTVSTCLLNPFCSNNPYAPFSVWIDPAPPDGATLSGILRLQVRGTEMANIELLPGAGYLPRYGTFGLSRDKFVGWLDFDTRTLPNGPVAIRASAFNVPAGQSGAIDWVAISPRTWNINNQPIPPGFAAQVVSAPADGTNVSGIVHVELRGTGITNAELLPASGYTPQHVQFNISADKTFAWTDFDTRALPDGPVDLRVSAFDVAPGQSNAREIVAMPTRRWNVNNGNNQNFTAHVTTAPMHGAHLTGWITIEVHGSGIKNVELLPANGYLPIIGRFVKSFDGTFAFMDFDTRTLPNGPLDVRVSAFDVPPGQPGAKEIVVLPARRWNVQN